MKRTRPFADFFYPLDSVRQWNRIYGKRGFYQFQAVIPDDRVTVALDRHTPGAAALVAGIWEVLSPRGIEAEDE